MLNAIRYNELILECIFTQNKPMWGISVLVLRGTGSVFAVLPFKWTLSVCWFHICMVPREYQRIKPTHLSWHEVDIFGLPCRQDLCVILYLWQLCVSTLMLHCRLFCSWFVPQSKCDCTFGLRWQIEAGTARINQLFLYSNTHWESHLAGFVAQLNGLAYCYH